ncbi:exopolysaccharide biosynthesis protein [Gilvimarinus sp. SDUM040013]|uniref:Exopolysaccharide biosynthesis protein n=1 Tax=Gilvimarinus gilvus TaxID=3058038 RepID=A0ABU4S2M1_9GAMM|nr:exopolysaccharide biosynthesis protein [Gilvimarinus sp. SDUM040013]MDO3385828.1 exopolysaccharide biosynthesis protein [Gilvimarinus sp. SDUM040013]MDX6851383.1 exopolysaccharide biosynthesis protein [Gilvimarinus sp. SDUM040013]
MTSAHSEGLTDTIELILESNEGQSVSVGSVLENASDRGFGPLLLVPALFTFLPTGGIPGVPIVAAAVIVLIAGQLLIGRRSPWLPARIQRMQLKKSSVTEVLEPAKRYTARVDRVLKPRLSFLLGESGLKAIAVLCIALALALIPLGPIPFAAAAPSGILVLLSLGIVARDGVLVLIGALLSVAVTMLLV